MLGFVTKPSYCAQTPVFKPQKLNSIIQKLSTILLAKSTVSQVQHGQDPIEKRYPPPIVHQWQVQGRRDEIERPTEDIPSNLVTVPGCRHHRHHHYHRLLENLLAEGKSRSRGIIETVFNENNLD
ncbi:hypothetical protein V1477_018831, partial [Vespula maculifrons]